MLKTLFKSGAERWLSCNPPLLLVLLLLTGAVSASGQQKGQYLQGQYGLNAGVIPDPGVTYMNMAFNYSANTLNDKEGHSIPHITDTYEFWVDENIIMLVPDVKVLGGNFAPYVAVSFANGSLVADITGTNLSGGGGGAGMADMWVEPLQMGWHLSRADVTAGYAFVAPTGRFTPGASNNVGSGYWGNHLNTGVTGYITKNKGTSANVFLDWEQHGKKRGTDITPGQALTMEWGLGQALPLNKQITKVAQLGVVGYDQWQLTANQGLTAHNPYYSVYSIGMQANYVDLKHGLLGFFKYYNELSAYAHPLGRTFVFGGSYSWTYAKPKMP